MNSVATAFRALGFAGERQAEAVIRDPLGRPLYSWRFALLPGLAGHGNKTDYDAAWYAPGNYAFVDSDLEDCGVVCYCFFRGKRFPAGFDTNVAAVTGPGTAFDVRRVRPADLPDDLIVFVEIKDSGVHWMEPGGDLDVRAVPSSITKGLKGQGLFVAFADGEVWFLTSNVPLENLKQFLTIDGAAKCDRKVLLLPYVDRQSTPRLERLNDT